MSLQPSVVMIQDWMASSHNTALSLEMIVAGLESLRREDVISVIREEEAGGAGQHRQPRASWPQGRAGGRGRGREDGAGGAPGVSRGQGGARGQGHQRQEGEARPPRQAR